MPRPHVSAGLLFLDGLMFLEPFGLLTILPFPAWMRQFIPAYKATRVIAEVVIESLPQSILQAYIYVVVVKHSNAGTALPRELAMMEFADALPKSILISSLATLKTWIELVAGARQAGLSVGAKAIQLWQVGAGLPLDALKKGTIVDWSCPYKLDSSEIQPLLDALSKNGSLTYLSLANSGITWTGSNATGLPLVEKMAHSASPLSSLETMVIRDNGYRMPIAKLRERETALSAIRAASFFTGDGPRTEEVLFIAELLREELEEDADAAPAVKLLTAARAGKLKRPAWEEAVTKLIVEGVTRRGHLLSLISAEALRDVGFLAVNGPGRSEPPAGAAPLPARPPSVPVSAGRRHVCPPAGRRPNVRRWSSWEIAPAASRWPRCARGGTRRRRCARSGSRPTRWASPDIAQPSSRRADTR